MSIKKQTKMMNGKPLEFSGFSSEQKRQEREDALARQTAEENRPLNRKQRRALERAKK